MLIFKKPVSYNCMSEKQSSCEVLSNLLNKRMLSREEENVVNWCHDILLLSYNYTMRFIGYDSIQTR